jgi:hypothetical protein
MLQTITGSLTKFCESNSARQSVGNVVSQIVMDVGEIDPIEWSKAVQARQRFLCLDYLIAMQNAHDEGLEVRCVIYKREEQVIGVAAFQIAHFTTSEEAYSGWFLKAVSRISDVFRGKHIHNILICGNAIATGEHGFSFVPGITHAEMAFLIARSMNEIARIEKRRGKRICAMVAKDFYPKSIGFANELTKARFRTFQVDHNMVMPVLPEWLSFDDYLMAMNTKFRTKAKAALTKSSTLEIIDADFDDLDQHMAVLTRLYENVHSRADFRLGKLNMKTLLSLVKELPNQFRVRLYKLNGEVVGFLTAMSCGDVLEAHVIGLNYDFNKDYALYQRMLYDYVALAIQLRSTRIVFGRTAAEIKSTVGAFPVDLTCCFLHRRLVSNALLNLILNYVKPSDYPQRDPWKAETREKIMEIKLYD